MTPLMAALMRRVHLLAPADYARSTVVVSPHPDDECLACGGTIAALTEAGVPVDVVHMTNGNRSHARFLDPSALAARRADEARAASRTLGVASERVHLLGFDDASLARHVADAADRLALILDGARPEQVFVPYRGELPADHRAAREAALLALARTGQRPRVFEYPVWFWNHWPWCRPWPAGRSRLRHAAAGAAALARLALHFRHGVAIHPHLPRKRAGLACHASQTVRPPGMPDWPILADVADGDWLALFFTGVELFHWRHSP